MSNRQCEKSVKKTRNVVTLEKKLKIIKAIENGGKFALVGRDFKLPKSEIINYNLYDIVM